MNPAISLDQFRIPSVPEGEKLPQKYSQAIEEAIDFLGSISGGCGAYPQLFNSDGNLWNVAGGTGAAGAFWALFYQLSTVWWNRWQRYGARYCYLTNGYGATAVNELTTLAMGEGFTYSSTNKTLEKSLHRWLKANKWHERSLEGFTQWLIDGELFCEVKGDGVDSKIRFVDPDLVYQDGKGEDGAYFAGLVFGDDDSDEPVGYTVWDKPWGMGTGKSRQVSVARMQHRANKHWGQKRGFSWMLPVLFDMYEADTMTGNLVGAAQIIAKMAVLRQSQAPQGAVQKMLSDIKAQQPIVPVGNNGTPPAPNILTSAEFIPRASIVDAAATMEYKLLGAVNYSQFGELLDMLLRKISSHFFLPMGIFGQDKSERGSYASELAAGSWNVRNIRRMQDKWKRLDLELLEMAGFDIEQIDVQASEVAVVDKKAAVDEEDMLVRNKVLSRATLAKNHDLDWEVEKKNLLAEQEELKTLFASESPAEEAAEDSRTQRAGD